MKLSMRLAWAATVVLIMADITQSFHYDRDFFLFLCGTWALQFIMGPFVDEKEESEQ